MEDSPFKKLFLQSITGKMMDNVHNALQMQSVRRHLDKLSGSGLKLISLMWLLGFRVTFVVIVY